MLKFCKRLAQDIYQEFKVEVYIIGFFILIFSVLFSKVRSYIEAEEQFQLQMLEDCIRIGEPIEDCHRMAIERLWSY